MEKRMYIEKVQVKLMKIDDRVQREKSAAVITRISGKFDISKVGLLTLSKRENGFYYIIDGQHRQESAILNGIEELESLVHEGLTLQEEADMFLALNKDRKIPTAIDNYKVAITAGSEIECSVQNILDKHDIKVGTHGEGIMLRSPQACINIFNKYDGEVLDQTLDTLIEVWGIGSVKSNAIRAMSAFLGDNKGAIQMDDLKERLSKASFPMVMNEVEKLRLTRNFSRKEGLEILIYQAYNKGRKNKLSKGSKVF